MLQTIVLRNTMFGGNAYELVPGIKTIAPMAPLESADGDGIKTKRLRMNDQKIRMAGQIPDPHKPTNENEKAALMAGLKKLLISQDQQQKQGTILAKNLDFSKPYS